MNLPSRRDLVGYGLAVLSPLAALVVRDAFGAALEGFRSQPFTVAVVLSAWAGGLWPGLLSVALSVLTIAFTAWPSDPVWRQAPQAVGLLGFAATGVTIAVLCGRFRTNERGERSARLVAEREIDVRARLERSLRESEEKFRLVCEGLPQIVTTMTPEGVVDYANPYWQSFSGLTDEDTRRGEWVKLLHPDDADLVVRRFRRALQAEQPLDRTFRLRRADGQYRWIQAQVTPVRAADGRVQKWISLLVDIEDRMRVEEQTRRAFLQAEQSNRLKDEFLATVSHELRTPLNAILGWTDILRRGVVEGARRQQAVDTIHRNARRQAELINDLLDMTRIMNGRLELELRAVDLESTVRAAVEAILPVATAKGLTLRLHADSASEIEGDPTRLQQIFGNLLSNAIKFTAVGGSIDVNIEPADENVTVVIRDTGVGMAADFIPHAFDRFRQGDSSTTRRQGGLGLGLAIARQLVELHGGQIAASSPGPGQGSSFAVSLPRPRGADTEAHVLTATPVELPSLAGICVLLVDDDADAREVGTLILRNCGAHVITATSAREAFATLEREPVSVILADIAMPAEDGLTFIRRVRSHNHRMARVPAAALTAYASAEDRARSLAAGYQLHLTKPIDPTEIAHAVVKLAKSQPAPRPVRSLEAEAHL